MTSHKFWLIFDPSPTLQCTYTQCLTPSPYFDDVITNVSWKDLMALHNLLPNKIWFQGESSQVVHIWLCVCPWLGPDGRVQPRGSPNCWKCFGRLQRNHLCLRPDGHGEDVHHGGGQNCARTQRYNNYSITIIKFPGKFESMPPAYQESNVNFY